MSVGMNLGGGQADPEEGGIRLILGIEIGIGMHMDNAMDNAIGHNRTLIRINLVLILHTGMGMAMADIITIIKCIRIHTRIHVQKHTVIPTLPTSLDAAAALIASSSLPSSSHPHPHSQSPNGISISNGNGFRPPNSPARTPPKTNANASGNAKGETQIQSPNHLYVDRPSRKSTSSASNSRDRDRDHFSHSVHGHGHGHTIGFGLGGLANLATKMNTHKSQPDLHAHVHALDGVGGMSPSKVKMKGKEVVISSPLLQRRGTGGTCSLIHTYTFLLSGR